MKIKKIEIPLYHGWLIIILTNDFKEIVEKYDLRGDPTQMRAFVFSDPDKNGITRYFACFDPEDSPNHVIAHETVHVVNKIFSERFILLDTENDEPQAYLTGWVFKQIEEFLNKNK